MTPPFRTTIPLDVLNAEIRTYLGVTGEILARNGYVRVFHALFFKEHEFRLQYFGERQRRQLYDGLSRRGLPAGALSVYAPFFMERSHDKVHCEYRTLAQLIEANGWYRKYGRGRNPDNDAAVDAFLWARGLTVSPSINDLFVYVPGDAATVDTAPFMRYAQEVTMLGDHGLPADAVAWATDLGVTTVGELIVTLRGVECAWHAQFVAALTNAGLDHERRFTFDEYHRILWNESSC